MLFQFLPTPIAVFPCDYVLRVGQPCREPSSFAIERTMPSDGGDVPLSQVMEQFSCFLPNIFKISLGR